MLNTQTTYSPSKARSLPAFTREAARILTARYHADPRVQSAAETLSPEQFLRLFVTFHGMTPKGLWRTHTYARFTDSVSGKDSFFLIPMARPTDGRHPNIRWDGSVLHVDEFETPVFPQSIPHTTPFWYFHYDPNNEERPFASMTLNLSPACMEKCVLCAGAKTGRVNNGMGETLSADMMLKKIFLQHPEAKDQLESVAVVTGCFPGFDALTEHLGDVRTAVERYASPSNFRVLEHNVTNTSEFDIIVKNLGYEVFTTLECFDQEMRNIALNGKVGRKGRDSREFMQIARQYAHYMDEHPELGQRFARMTYLVGIDSLDVTEKLFSDFAEINRGLTRAKVIPWLSIFTPYSSGMRVLQRPDFDLGFLLRARELAVKYFGAELMEQESGGTNHGFARGLF